MGFSLDKVVPWGRSLNEYRAMFNLCDGDIRRRILGCGDGPASFNVGWTKVGGSVVSVDPIYEFSSGQIKHRIDEVKNVVIEQLKQNENGYVWKTIKSIDHLYEVRLAAMQDFLDDYELGKAQGRYLQGELPKLLFNDKSFDISLSSHLLFLYSKQLPLEFHIDATNELLRVSNEVRIFPILSLDGSDCPYIQTVINHFNNHGKYVETIQVDYEFQVGGNKMMVIRDRVKID
jgi:hypothetical protein